MVTLGGLKRETSYGYSKMLKEDPIEKSHREAQFKIYKNMKQIDQIGIKKSSWIGLRICKFKGKIGRKLLGLRKTMLCNMSKTKVGACSQFMGHFKKFKRLLSGSARDGGGGGGRRGGGSMVNHLPQPLFI